MTTSLRLALFIDTQNSYLNARECFFGGGRSGVGGQFNPMALGRLIASRGGPRGAPCILSDVRVYSGRPVSNKDWRSYAAHRRQSRRWISDGATVITRDLRYPRTWPTEPAQESGKPSPPASPPSRPSSWPTSCCPTTPLPGSGCCPRSTGPTAPARCRRYCLRPATMPPGPQGRSRCLQPERRIHDGNQRPVGARGTMGDPTANLPTVMIPCQNSGNQSSPSWPRPTPWNRLLGLVGRDNLHEHIPQTASDTPLGTGRLLIHHRVAECTAYRVDYWPVIVLEKFVDAEAGLVRSDVVIGFL